MWLYTGTQDTIVASGLFLLHLIHTEERADRSAGVVKKTLAYYQNYITNSSTATIVTNISSEHAWITDK